MFRANSSGSVVFSCMQRLKWTYPRVLGALLLAAVVGCSAEARKSRLLESADSYFESGDYEKAKIEYLNVLRADPQNAMAIQRLGTIWYEQGALLHAASYLLRARDLTPDDLDARTKLGLVFLSGGQFAEARKEAIAILDRSPTHGEAMLLLAEASRDQRDIDDSERRLHSINADGKSDFHLALAAISFWKKDLASAESAVKQALSLDPKSIGAHLALGKIYLSRNDLAGTDREFKAAAQLAPARSPARLAYAEFKIRTGAVDVARELLNEITREAPDSLPAWRLLAQIAFAEKKFDESLKLLDNAILRDPANFEARLLQAQVWLAQGQVKKAIEGLESLNKAYPKVLVIKYQLARAYLQDKNAAQAAFVLNQALARNPNHAEARLLLGEITLRNGNAQEVITSMLDLLKQQPSLGRAQVILAQAYQSLGRLDDAAAIFREQIRTNPKSPAAYLSLGLILRQQNKLDEARKTIETAHQLAPKSLLAVSQLVDLDIQGKDYDAALRRVHDQLQLTPDSPGAYFLEGKIYAAQGKWDDAKTALLNTLERDPAYPNATGLLVSTYLAAGKLPNAIALLEGELSRNPDDTRALMTVAMMYDRTKDFPRAREAYEKLVSLKPDYAPALNNLAYLYAEHFDLLDKARELAQKARALQPADPGIADTLGWILYKRGDYQQALTLLQESARKLPENPEVQFHLGMASYMMGQKDSAREAFLRAAAAPNDFPGKEEVQRRLALLDSTDGKAVTLSSKDLEAALKQQPSDPVAQMRVGESYEKEEAFAEAAAAYEQALKLNPKLLAAACKLAELNAGPLQASDKALRFAQKARELAPNDPKVLAILGNAAYQASNFTWAYSLLREAARLLPNDPKILGDLAWASYSQGKIVEAQALMQRVLDAHPDSAQSNDARLFLAMTALDKKDANLTAAQMEAQRVLDVSPSYVPALMLRARTSAQRGESDAAVAAYSEVLRHFPDFTPAQKELASIYLGNSEKFDEAYGLAAKARKSLPDDPELAQILAEASYQKREFAYAIQLLQQSASEKPLDAKQLYILGMSHFNAKDKLRSREALDKALDSGLPEPMAGDAKRTITELQTN